MKIKRVDTVSFIRALGMKNSFIVPKHKIELYQDVGCMIDDKFFIPMSNILEIEFEEELKKKDKK